MHDLDAAVGGAAGAGDCAAFDELVGEGNDEAGGYAELGGDVALGVGESGVHYGEKSYLFVAEAEFFDSSAEFLGDVVPKTPSLKLAVVMSGWLFIGLMLTSELIQN